MYPPLWLSLHFETPTMPSDTSNPTPSSEAASPKFLPMRKTRRTSLKPRRVLAIPELLRLVSGFLSRSDAFRFAQCSHTCFQAAVGSIWNEMRSPPPLLNLFFDLFEHSDDETDSSNETDSDNETDLENETVSVSSVCTDSIGGQSMLMSFLGFL